MAQVNPPNIFVLNNFVRGTAHQNLSVMQDIGTVNNIQCFPHVMVCDQNTQAFILKVMHKRTNLIYGNWVNAGEGFIQQKIFGVSCKTAGNLYPPSFSAG